MKGTMIKAKTIVAANVYAFFLWLLLYSRAISRTGVETTTKAVAKKRNNPEPKATTKKQTAKTTVINQTIIIPFIDNTELRENFNSSECGDAPLVTMCFQE